MAGEIRIMSGLTIQKRSGALWQINFNRSQPFSTDLINVKGPCVGTVAVTDDGVDLDLSQLTSFAMEPGEAWFQNLSALYTVDVGIRDPDTGQFYPFMELKPGRGQGVPLSRNLLEQYDVTGTGTGGANNKLHARLTDLAAPEGTTVNVECSIFAR